MELSKIESEVWNRIANMLDGKSYVRDYETETILSRRDIKAILKRIQSVKERIFALFPLDFERCELSPEIVSVIKMDGYRIENTIIQSMREYYVPVNVYIPLAANDKRMPAILVPMGHWPEGKRLSSNQILCANFAKKGIVAATYDPLCQGERDMFPEKQEEKLGNDMWAVMEHLIPGIQCYLLGENLMSYFLWDGMRVIDYLCSREDVDSSRIGCTGQSGGGTQTQYLTIIDERIKVASPIQSVSKQTWSLRFGGVGDTEQSPIGRDRDGALDLADNFWAAFPKPVMLNIGLRDMFDLRGLRHVESEIGSLYNLLGYGENFAVYEDDCEHVITERIRKNAYRWFTRWFFGTEDETEDNIRILEKDDLRCLYKNTRTTVDVIFERMERCLPEKRITREEICSLISAEADGYTILPLDSGNDGETFLLCTRSHQDSYCRLRRGLKNKLRLVLNLLPDDEYLSSSISGDEWVLEMRPFGYQDTVSKKAFDYDNESNNAIAYFLSGGSILSDRLSQILTALDFLSKQSGGFDVITMEAKGQGAILAIMASLYDKRITAIKAEGMPALYRQYFGIRDYLLEESAIVPGIIKYTDLPEMAALTGIPIELTSVTGPMREKLPLDFVKTIYKDAVNVNIFG